MSERVQDYDYEVPAEAVAQEPAARREQARLLRVARDGTAAGTAAGTGTGAEAGGVRGEGHIPDLLHWLRPGDLLVLNAARVAAAKLSGIRVATGGKVSVLALRWEGRRATVLLGTRGRLAGGEEIEVDGDRWRLLAPPVEGRAQIQVVAGREVERLLAEVGRMPLPPYIRRDPIEDPRDDLDRERYRTTFTHTAEAAGNFPPAVAAPTAGLHLTPELIDGLEAKGVHIERLCLAVGEGTFRPMHGELLSEHRMHTEEYELPAALAEAYAAARREGRRVVALGTTVVRALESAVRDQGAALEAGPGSTDLFIRPGHVFRAVDALITNFHQPRSTLLVLVSTFAGQVTIREAYAEALGRGFRLFSYGDAMLLE